MIKFTHKLIKKIMKRENISYIRAAGECFYPIALIWLVVMLFLYNIHISHTVAEGIMNTLMHIGIAILGVICGGFMWTIGYACLHHKEYT